MPDTHPSAGDGLIFVLDIGTRSVVGIAGRQQGGLFHVAASAVQPHQRRAMIDGQIEDIEEVARVAGIVKNTIEQQLGVSFQQVSVAAAGRALKTTRATASAKLPVGVPITARDVFHLENSAVNEARQMLDAEKPDVPYYCVGHSVVRYQLDGYPFATILDHRGGLAEVEIIATFLPTEVVSSLRRSMELLGLEIDTLTMEPIAAMRAVIPQDLRLLNLALADIGAGTSDIALSSDGTVSGFTMATVAGDEVTEAIIKQYLVSFNEAEQIKLAAGAGTPVTFTDILGFEHTVEADDVLATLQPAAQTLAQVIADKIRETNGGPPAAVFLVGGGSKTPGLPALLAEMLELGPQRVAVAGTQFSGKVLNEDAGLDGPEYATPVGIALVAADNAENEGASVTINGKRVRLFTQQSCSMMDALLFGGYSYSDLMGRNGRSLTFTLNGVRTVLRGEPYTAAQLSLNGLAASLNLPVENGDAIEIIPATSGADAEAKVSDYADGAVPLAVTLNGTPLAAGLVALINGALVPADTPIFDDDTVDIHLLRTVAELLAAAGLSADDTPVTVNGVLAMPGHLLNDDDTVLCPASAATTPPAATTNTAETIAPPQATPTPAAPVKAAPPVAETQPPAAAPAPTAPSTEASVGEASAPSPAFAAPMADPAGSALPPKPEPPADTAEVSPPDGLQPASKPAPADTAPPTPQPLHAPLRQAENTGRAGVPAPTPPPASFKAPPPPDALWPAATPAPAEDSPPPVPRTQSLRIDLNGKTVVLPPKPDGAPYQLFDLFALVDIDPAQQQSMVEVSVNGNPNASYLDEIHSGDKVHIG